MLKEKDFDVYGLESLLTDSKYKIDTTDPERTQIDNSAANTLRSLQRFVIAKHFEDKWMMHGLSDNLKESFISKFDEFGMDKTKMDHPIELKSDFYNKAEAQIKNFCEIISNSKYLKSLDDKLGKVKKDVSDIFLDEETTYEHCDLVAFAKTKIHGYNQENFSKKLKGLQILLGAFNVKERGSYEAQSIRESMQWNLLQAGFSFDEQMIVAPKDENVIEHDTLENLGWTPEKVNALNSTLDSVMKLDSSLNVLGNILPKTEAIPATRMTATLVENCYNVRNIMAYVKNTLYTMCNQYLSMVRSYQ